MKRQKGITLIALVITIIVLLILAGVSISMTLGENGILTRAENAVSRYSEAEQEEKAFLENVAEYMNKYEVSREPGSGEETTPPKTEPEQTIKKYKEEGIYTTEETILTDDNKNEVVVPKGFKIAEDSGTNVTEGIVIEDKDIKEGIGNDRGNQYVWIPVGKGIKKTDGKTVDIILGRYTFAEDGTKTLVQSAENYEDDITVENYFKELIESREGKVVEENKLKDLNTTALNLIGFIESTKNKGGYYIARYEASYGIDEKANSKVSDSFTKSNGSSYAPTTEGQLWNNITQLEAATASRNLYTELTSDLINSYAWDTAIVYIQEFSGDRDYSRQNSVYSDLSNTGNIAEGIKDEVCKINDMASNTYEWTTEYSSNIDSTNGTIAYPCVGRGGGYNDSNNYTSFRGSIPASRVREVRSFRFILYM